jgi:hypothetical protein
MFATYVAVKAMEEAGHWEYAAAERANLLSAADQLELESVENLTLPFPDGTHALAFKIGCGLVEAVGWEQVSQLGIMIDEETGRHDLKRWVNKLERDDCDAVMRVLADSDIGAA